MNGQERGLRRHLAAAQRGAPSGEPGRCDAAPLGGAACPTRKTTRDSWGVPCLLSIHRSVRSAGDI